MDGGDSAAKGSGRDGARADENGSGLEGAPRPANGSGTGAGASFGGVDAANAAKGSGAETLRVSAAAKGSAGDGDRDGDRDGDGDGGDVNAANGSINAGFGVGAAAGGAGAGGGFTTNAANGSTDGAPRDGDVRPAKGSGAEGNAGFGGCDGTRGAPKMGGLAGAPKAGFVPVRGAVVAVGAGDAGDVVGAENDGGADASGDVCATPGGRVGPAPPSASIPDADATKTWLHLLQRMRTGPAPSFSSGTLKRVWQRSHAMIKGSSPKMSRRPSGRPSLAGADGAPIFGAIPSLNGTQRPQMGRVRHVPPPRFDIVRAFNALC